MSHSFFINPIEGSQCLKNKTEVKRVSRIVFDSFLLIFYMERFIAAIFRKIDSSILENDFSKNLQSNNLIFLKVLQYVSIGIKYHSLNIRYWS